MTAQQLKNSILQMAVQGKLVPQDSNDEPASVLLERIKAEKQELIKAGKIKKDKKTSEIFRGSTRNLPYAFCEQIDKEIKDISDKIPFEIPESWEWCRLSDIAIKEIKRGKSPVYAEKGSVLVFAQKCNTKLSGINISLAKYLSDSVVSKYPQEEYLQNNDIIVNSTGTGTLGRIGIYSFIDTSDNVSLVPDSHITIVRTNSDFSQYIYQILKWYQPTLEKCGEGSTKQKELKADKIKALLIPLPPLPEQHRIVAKIEQLLPYIEKYEKAETQLTALNKSFPDMLKKSILQEAVQGKLVPQNSDDEPASVLLERIRAEKQALIKAGKIKKDKHESVIITRDKIPYEIPDSWVWCKLSDLAILENGDRSSKYPVEADYVEIGIPFFGAKDIDGDMMSFQNVRFISQQKYDELGNGKLVDGDIICLLRGSVGKTAKFEANEQFDTGFICAQMLIIRLLDKSLFGYISSYFKSPDYTNYVESKVTGTAVRQMPAKEMGNLLIPLPPLNEQHRIVAKIEEIMPYINTITK